MEASRELTTVERYASLAMPEMDMQTAVARFQQLGQFVSTILKENVDYGKIPGTPKNTLLKPGAEKLCTFFGLTKEEVILDREMDWTGEHHGGEPFFYFHYQIRLFRKGQMIAEADGSANSWESKHRYRQGEYKCPQCGKETIRKGKADKGGGYYCWSKLGGCGATFKAGDQSIEGQDVGKKKNPDPADLVNTIQKMAYKRAFVAATLVAVNASEYFTQDLEDLPEYAAPPSEPPVANGTAHPQAANVGALVEFDKLVAGKKAGRQRHALGRFLEATAAANNVTIDALKSRASQNFEAFWAAFETWNKKQAKPTETPPEAPAQEPPTEGQGNGENPTGGGSAPHNGITTATLDAIGAAMEATGLDLALAYLAATIPPKTPLDELTEDQGQKVLAWYKSQ